MADDQSGRGVAKRHAKGSDPRTWSLRRHGRPDGDRLEVGEARPLDLGEEIRDVEAAVSGRVGGEPPGRLLQLPFAADAVAAAGLVPRDRDVDEPLEEIALVRPSGAPEVFEHLVRGEVLAAADEVESAREARGRP